MPLALFSGRTIMRTICLVILAPLLMTPVLSQTSTQKRGPPVPVVDITRPSPSTIKLSWPANPDRVFSVQYSDDLLAWTTVGVGKMSSFADNIVNLVGRYYRIASNSPPELGPVGDKTVRLGDTLQFSLSASDPDGDSLFFGASNLPPGAVFDPETGEFRWTPLPEEEGSYGGVRFSVVDGGEPGLADYEDITIIVGEIAPVITVISPRGGDSLEAGIVKTIEWISQGDIGHSVHIDFSPDGGETWYVIRENAPDAGYYNWIVPDSRIVPQLPSDDCWIAIWSEDESLYGLVDDAFSIGESAVVISSIYLIGGDGEYLGDCTTNSHFRDSIWNELGPYGSVTSWTSIWNPVGIYGSDYSELSPWDPFALDPPYIFINDEYVASLTTNYLIWDAIHPQDFFDWVEWIGY